jgi:hypothetical protein
MAVTALAIIAPFLAWNSQSYISDTVGYFFSGGTDNDPIRGHGLTGLLLSLGVIRNRWDQFPSGPIEIAAAIPLLGGLWLRLRRRWSWPWFWVGNAGFAFVAFFFGRLMVPNYFQLLAILLSLAAVEALPLDLAESAEGIRRRSLLPAPRVMVGVLAVLVLLVVTRSLEGSLAPAGDPRYRVALTADDRAAYVATSSGTVVSLLPDGTSRVMGRTVQSGDLPDPLSIAVDGSTVLVGTDRGLYSSRDGGRTFELAPGVDGGFITAVAARGGEARAGSWGRALWVSHDAGRTWRAADVPEGDTEFEAIALGGGIELAATELGLQRSRDQGQTWVHIGGPDRLTSLSLSNGAVYGADWRGTVYGSGDSGVHWARLAQLPRGIWSIATGSRLVGSAGGLYVGLVPAGGALSGKEVLRVASAGGRSYAAEALGPVMRSDDAGKTWRAVFTDR